MARLVFLVTGGSRGLGREIVKAALAAGHRVVAGARNPERLGDLVAEYGDALRPVRLDVTDPAEADAAVATAVREFGRLDVVVNNAGYADLAAVEDVTLEDFRAQVETNFFGVVIVTKAALPVLREQGGGRIIQISSVGGRLASPGLGAYQAAKAAVGSFSGVLAAETAGLGIKVTVLEPGGMRTDWAGSSMKIPPISQPYADTVGARAAIMGRSTLTGDPARVAAVVLDVAAQPDPPLRLLLGSDAYTYATAAARAQLASDESHHALSISTDHPEATEADRDPLGPLAP
ncbi:SDR family NAD(P)-dependent oxidoreductase [Actinocorallia sp. A-T 12471]|uniref:SDR family NAD(P)-dependent oxidoreductase n=1 Tax=Actinocorallia sp. A-T 12471 TaxID=3089813 RepID=UPI0029D14CED|nr:SDR family NAD(P)-dependent oxidoreductase [Actinocorallia sp. A-T 12471]MDX6742331.1 SDR family NAD(P)-dependent oxidoreductase [Actinocorallia sp. A-T 12471]